MQNAITKVPFHGTAEQEQKLLAVIERLKDERGALMPILQEAQEIYGYLPIEVQKIIAQGLDVSLEEVYGVATFYSQFTLNPKGKHKNIGLPWHCLCYVKGSGEVYARLAERLGVEGGECTADGRFRWKHAAASAPAAWLPSSPSTTRCTDALCRTMWIRSLRNIRTIDLDAGIIAECVGYCAELRQGKRDRDRDRGCGKRDGGTACPSRLPTTAADDAGTGKPRGRPVLYNPHDTQGRSRRTVFQKWPLKWRGTFSIGFHARKGNHGQGDVCPFAYRPDAAGRHAPNHLLPDVYE